MCSLRKFLRLFASVMALSTWLVGPAAGLDNRNNNAPPADAAKTKAAEKTPGQFFTVDEPITEQAVKALETAAQATIRKALEEGKAPVLVFEFRSRSSADQPASRFGAVLELCQMLSRNLAGARLVVGYVPEPLTGYAALAPLACQEVIFQNGATIGPVIPSGTDALTTRTVRGFVAELAASLGRSPDLYEGLVDDKAELLELTAADNQRYMVLKDRLAEFSKSRAVAHQQPAWPAGGKRVLDATRARGVLSRLSVDKRNEILEVYRLPDAALRAGPLAGTANKAMWIKLEGRLDAFKLGYIRRKLALAQATETKLVIFEMDVRGDSLIVATDLADQLAKMTGVQKVAYITGKAEGAVLMPLMACDQILMSPTARLGDVYLQSLPDGKSKPKPPTPEIINTARNRAVELARSKGYAAGLAKGLFDPSAIVLEAQDMNSGGVVCVEEKDLAAEPKRFQKRRVAKEANTNWILDSPAAVAYGLTNVEESADGLKARLGLDPAKITVIGPSWVDYLVAVLNNRVMTGFILTMGLFLLVLEFKLPGIGLPAIGSAVCFLLFFWSHYLSGTADQLEIMLFAVGLICLAIELFVFPGFGVFGLAGVILTVCSIVLASHTFIWPSGANEYKEMSGTLVQLMVAMMMGIAGIIWIGRNMHRVPLLRGLVLRPGQAAESDQGPETIIAGDSELNLSHLIGQIGLTTTSLRPTGKARFGEQIVDATAQIGSIDANQSIEVVSTRGLRVIVRETRLPDDRPSHHSPKPFEFNEDLFAS
ncbi:MAG: NfeD family protein [Isosphaeraceae bacterium]